LFVKKELLRKESNMGRKWLGLSLVFSLALFICLVKAYAADKVSVDMFGGDIKMKASSGGDSAEVSLKDVSAIADEGEKVSVDITEDTEEVSVEASGGEDLDSEITADIPDLDVDVASEGISD
jgi:hypothetical protein